MNIRDFIEGPFVLLTNPQTLDNTFLGVYATDLLSAAIKSAQPNDLLITIISHANTIGVAMMLDLSGVIVAEDRPVSEAMLEKANEENIAILKTPLMTHQVILWMVHRGLL